MLQLHVHGLVEIKAELHVFSSSNQSIFAPLSLFQKHRKMIGFENQLQSEWKDSVQKHLASRL